MHRASKGPVLLNLCAEPITVGVITLAQALHLLHFSHELVYPYEIRLNIHSAADAARMFVPDGGQRYAPDAYRVGIPALGRGLVWVTQTLHPSWVAAGIDAVFFLLASWTCYKIVIAGWETQAAPRRLATAAYLLLIQFPLQWVLPWHRSETMAVTAYVAVALWCLQKAAARRQWWVWLLAATALQTLVRTDVPLILGIGMMSVSIVRRTDTHARRRSMMTAGAGVAAMATGVQLLLQGVIFPHLSYQPGVPKIQLGYNLHGHNLAVLLIALFPFAAFQFFKPGRAMWRDELSVVACLSSLLYLSLWFVVGIVAEVRLFVPFLFALSIVFARAAAQRFAMPFENA